MNRWRTSLTYEIIDSLIELGKNVWIEKQKRKDYISSIEMVISTAFALDKISIVDADILHDKVKRLLTPKK